MKYKTTLLLIQLFIILSWYVLLNEKKLKKYVYMNVINGNNYYQIFYNLYK